VQMLEAVLILDRSHKVVDVGERSITKPCLTHEEVTLVVQFLAGLAEGDDGIVAFVVVTLNL